MKVNKFWKKTLCLLLTVVMVIGNTSPVVADTHEHETAAEIVTEIMDATIEKAESVIDETGLLDAADVIDTKDALVEADGNLADSMENLGTAVEDANAAIDALEGKVTKDDVKEINASLSAAYNEAAGAYADAVEASSVALEDITNASKAYEEANKISEDAAKVAEIELKAAQEALNVAVEAARFANSNMTNLKNEFAKATELASQWNAEAEEALAVATENLAVAQEALDNALAAIETENVELKAAIDEFKRCYDLFLEAADVFYESIQTAIAAQEYLDALYAEYEAAQAAVVEAQTAYDAVCAEYTEAGYPSTYETYSAKLAEYESDKDAAVKALEDLDSKIAEYKATLETYESDSRYLELEGYKEVLTDEDASSEDKAEAAKSAARAVIENKLAGGYTVKEVLADGENVYGKADKEYFVVLDGEKLVARYGYVLDEATGVVSVYEMVNDGITNYIVYNDKEYELVEVEGEAYIVVGLDKIELTKIGSDYFETLTIDGRKIEDETQFTNKVNVLSLIEAFDINLGDVFNLDVELAASETVNAEDGTGEYIYEIKLFEGTILEYTAYTFVIAIERDAETGVYSHRYYYTKNCEVEECENPDHTGTYGHVEKTPCTLEEHEESGTHDKTYTIACTNSEHSEGNHEVCTNTDHEIYGCDAEYIKCTNESHAGHGYYTYKDYSVCTQTHTQKILWGTVTIPCAGAITSCDYVERTEFRGITDYVPVLGTPIYESSVATCGAVENSDCIIDSACNQETVTQEDCNIVELGKCYKNVYIELDGVFPETIPQASYGEEWYYVLSDEAGLYIELESATLRLNETEDGKYTYLSKVEFKDGGDADKFYTYGTEAKADSDYYADMVQQLKNDITDAEADRPDVEDAKVAAEATFNTWNENFTELKTAFEALQIAVTTADTKELGTLVNLPRNLADLIEIFSLDLENSDVTIEEIFEAIATLSKGISSLEDALAVAKAIDTLSSILPGLDLDFGYTAEQLTTDYWMNQGWDGIQALLTGEVLKTVLNSDMGQALTNPNSYKYTYFHAWIDAITTKIKVVENALDLVEAGTTTIEAGVDAVIAGTELADVAIDAVLATAEKEILEATVDVLGMATELLGTSEEVVVEINNAIVNAQARTEAAYLAAVAERNALNQLTIVAPYADELATAKANIEATDAIYHDLFADILAADAPLATAKELSASLKDLAEHEHNYAKVVTKATCTEDGSIVYTCTICPDTYTEVLPAIGHTSVDGASKDAHTRCDVCGEVLSTEHEFASKVTKEPTCTEVGTMVYTCECGYSYEEDIQVKGHTVVSGGTETVHAKCSTCGEVISAAHSFTSEVTTAPSCEGTGVETFTCECGYSYTETVPATGHNVVNGGTAEVHEKCDTCGKEFDTAHNYASEVTTQPTCEAEGVRTYTCECGHSYTETIDMKEHTPVNGGDADNHLICEVCGTTLSDKHEFTSEVTTQPTCEAEGVRTYTCECGHSYTESIAAKGHTTVNGVTAEAHTKCSVCGEVLSVAHSYTSEVTTQPTCEAEGVRTYTCTCGHVYTESIEATGHKVVNGATADVHQKCETCGEVLSTTHSVTAKVTTEPTCEEKGVRTYTCGCGYTYTEEIEATGHTAVKGGTEEAHEKCETCGEALNANHSITSEVTTDPTCEGKGERTYTCECGYTYTEEIEATGHTAVKGGTKEVHEKCETCGTPLNANHSFTSEVTTAPTCENIGAETHTCACGYFYVTEVAALGHDYAEEFTVDTEATCTTVGSQSKHCSRCDSRAEVTEIPALGHDWTEWETSKEAVRGELGEEKRECQREGCEEYETREVKVLVTEITLDKTTVSALTGAKVQLTATVGPENVTDETVTWTTSNEEIATVTEAGLVTAVSAGVVEIKAIANDGSEVTAMCVITITDPVVNEPEDNTPSTPVEPSVPETDNTTEDVVEEVETVVENETVEVEEIEEAEEVVIEDDETPLADGSDDEVETSETVEETEVVIEDEKTPLADGEIGNDGGNVGLAVAVVTGVGVVGAGAAVVANQAGIFGAGAAASAAASTAAAGTTAGASSNSFMGAIAAFFKKLFKK